MVSVGFSAAPVVNTTAIGDEQVLDVVGLAPLVDHAVLRLLRHAVGAEIVGGGIGRRVVGPLGADRLVDRAALLVGVLAHGDVVGVIGEGHLRRRQAMGVLELRIERDRVALLRHVLADQPHAGGVGVVVQLRRIAPAPGARLQEGRHERQAQRQRLHLVAAGEAAGRIVAALVL